MFIPLRDLNPHRRVPLVNTLLIAVNLAVFVYELTLPERGLSAFLMSNATIPARVPAWLAGHVGFQTTFLPLITSMFLHSGFAHILGNMLFLWIFGDNVEDYFGHLGYFLFYFVCGISAGLFHIAFNLHSTVPALGASGAISGVMAAYALLYPRARILTLVFVFLVPIPAIVILGYWFLLQFLEGLASVGIRTAGGVAWWAHIGGFLVGLLITAAVKKR
jgi:membrane associated rhomboid family serine protease